MKYSIRFIQVNYTAKGKGHSILILRGMEIRSYEYSTRRFDTILDASNSQFDAMSYDDRITFTRVYPE